MTAARQRQAGAGQPGDGGVTIADVAHRAGVSKSTVSRVLNGRGELGVATADRVRRVIEELGYVPSSRAVGLARGSTQTIGLMVPSLAWPWLGDVLQGVADVLESRSHGLLLFTCTRGEESIRQFTAHVLAQSIDGLIVIMPEGTVDRISELQQRGLPVVVIDDREDRSQFTSVSATNREGAADAARHLLSLHRKRPLVLAGIERFGCTRDRLDGFLDVYAQAGRPVEPPLIVPGQFSYNGGRAAIRTALDAGVVFDAVFAHNDLSAMGALHTLREEGLRVPDDVAVIGFDDISAAAHTEPPLTSVRQPLHEMGSAAAGLVLGRLAGSPTLHTSVTLPTQLVVRASTKA